MFIEINRTNIFNNTASFGGMISACNSEVTVLEEELFVSEDPVYSFCTLYDGDVTCFNITSPRDLDNTMSTSSTVSNVLITSLPVFLSSVTIFSSIMSTATNVLTISSQVELLSDTKINSNTMSTTSYFSTFHVNPLISVSDTKTKLVENTVISLTLSSMKTTNKLQTTAHDHFSSSLYSSVITTSEYMQELLSRSTQMSISSTLGHVHTDISIDAIIKPSSTSGSSQIFSSSQNERYISSVAHPEDFTSEVLMSSSVLKVNTASSLEEVSSTVPGTRIRPGTEVGTKTSDADTVAPSIVKLPDINNYNNYQYNSLHGIVNTALMGFLFVVVFVLAIGFLYMYKVQGKYHTSFKSTKNSKILFEAQSYSKTSDLEDLHEKEEIF